MPEFTLRSVFLQPFWLAAGLLLCGGVVFFLKLRTIRRRKELEKFAAPHLLPHLTANVSQRRRRLKNILFVLGLACLFIALARPQWGSRSVELRRRGIDILIGFDVSKSMLAPDIKPSRLQRAKLAVRDFAARLDGDRIGLLPFAGTSFLLCPLTTDYDAFTASLDALDTTTIPKGGTNIGAVIRDAVRVLKKESNYKILVLITDGEDLHQDALRAAALAKKEKMIIYAVGVGTAQGELIPLPDSGPGNFVKDPADNNFITSKLDDKTLAAVAATTGGSYVPLGNMGQGLDTVYQGKLALIPKEEHGRRKRKVPLERFQWLLGAAILLLSADFLLIGRRRQLRLPHIFTAGRRKKQHIAAVLLLCLFSATQARADKGLALFQGGKYKQAAEFYQHAIKEQDNPVLQFNLGAALHKQRKFNKAANAFSKALQTDDVSLQAKSYYNRGLSQYYAGRTVEQTDLAQAVAALKQADKSFAAATKLLPTQEKQDKAARYQKEAEKEWKRLEKQQQQQEQQNKEQDAAKQEQQNFQEQQDSSNDNKEQEKKDKDEKQQSEKNTKQENSNEQKKKENKSQKQENKSKQKQEQSSKPDSDTKQDEKKSEQKKPTSANGQKDKEERSMNKMTEEEARILLDSLKDEQGELNFITQEAADGDEVGRDW